MSDVSFADVPLRSEVLREMEAERALDVSDAEILRRRTRAEWLDSMRTVGMPAVAVADGFGEAFEGEQARVNHFVVEVDDPIWGRTTQAGHPIRIEPRLEVRGPAPALGEHTDDVLSSVGKGRPVPSRPVPSRALSALSPRPLEGLKVLDFGMFMAGPIGPQLMADLGADVVKVEPPTGDRVRHSDRVFSAAARGKRSVTLDLRSPASQPVLMRLLQWADVVHHNLRMPAARLLGLDYESVRAVNPSVVFCHVSSYGPDGPIRDWPGVDPTCQAVVGWMQEVAGVGNPPRWFRIGLTDDLCALSSVIGVLLALRHADRSGEGADVRASILGAATLTVSETMMLANGSVAPYPRLDHDQTSLSPTYRIFECKDGWLAVAAVDEGSKRRLLAEFSVTAAEELPNAFRPLVVAEVTGRLAAVDVPSETVRLDNESAFFDDPLMRKLGITIRNTHPVYGELEQIGTIVEVDNLNLRLDRPAPTLGQHTAEVLTEVGVGPDELAQLARAGLIVGPGLPSDRSTD